MMTPSVQTFIDKVMRCENATTRQVACHEAGHRFFWGITFPEIKTKYSVVDGLPLVTRKSDAHELDLDKMTVEEASRLAYIKLGGIASEMIMFGIEGDAEAIADFITNDFFSDPPTFDWKDDAQFGGDIATTITLIQSKSNPHPESVKQNFKIVLQSCIKIILENKEAFDKECTDAMNLFVLWKKQGRWHL